MWPDFSPSHSKYETLKKREGNEEISYSNWLTRPSRCNKHVSPDGWGSESHAWTQWLLLGNAHCTVLNWDREVVCDDCCSTHVLSVAQTAQKETDMFTGKRVKGLIQLLTKKPLCVGPLNPIFTQISCIYHFVT